MKRQTTKQIEKTKRVTDADVRLIREALEHYAEHNRTLHKVDTFDTYAKKMNQCLMIARYKLS